MITTIQAVISEIRGNRSGDLSETVRVTADYEASNIASSVTFEIPFNDAKQFFVGQHLTIKIAVEEP